MTSSLIMPVIRPKIKSGGSQIALILQLYAEMLSVQIVITHKSALFEFAL